MTATYIGSDLSVAIAWLAWTLIILYLAWPHIHRALQPRRRTPAPARRTTPPHPTTCHAGRDGDCTWHACPQLADNEPATTGRHCPYDWTTDDD